MKMIKKISLLLLMLISVSLAKAQTKTTVAFLPVSYDEELVNKNEARNIQEAIINSFVSSKRFIVVDRQRIEELEKEKNLQRTEAFMDSEDAFTDGLSKGANYLVDGNIIGIRHSEDSGGWVSSVTVQLRMLNVSTGEIMATESINSELQPESNIIKKAMKSHYSKDELRAAEARSIQLREPKSNSHEAFASALVRLGENINKFTSSILPIDADIVTWDTKKNELVLSAGNGIGVQVGQLVDIVKFSSIMVGDREVPRSEVLGTAWIIRVDDQNFSVATIIDNHKAIGKAAKSNEKLGVTIR